MSVADVDVTSTYEVKLTAEGVSLVSGGSEISADRESSEPSQFVTRAHGETTLNTGPIVFHSGVPVGGWGALTVFGAGGSRFSGHFHDSGAGNYNVALAIVVKAQSGTAYAWATQGHLNGTFTPGSRDYNWDISPLRSLDTGDANSLVSWWWQAATNWNIGGMVNSCVSNLGGATRVVWLNP
ncbi:hypothetical protein [Nocardia aurantia]|uniref:Uncharacterized protein n=1 Tax=Nocardia aurantia TaxID=2585199 RepID=A0A7K0DV17_9NOCA|nr:hypothetical protein [Nocardia aurantia]MQY29589.1 hypothetical protein [Nocardia aurantia]